MKIGQYKLANEWMREESATPEAALNTWNEMEAEFKANRAMSQEPRSMDLADGGRIGFADKNAGLVKSRNQYGEFTTTKKIGGPQTIDYDLLKKIIKNAKDGNKFFSEEDISKAYAEATDQTNITKRKHGDKILTYKKLDSKLIKNLGGIESKEAKVKKVFQDILASEDAIPEITFKGDNAFLNKRPLDNWRKLIIRETGIGLTNTNDIISKLPSYKNSIKLFERLAGSGSMKKDLAHLPLSQQLEYATEAVKGKPSFSGISGVKSLADPNFITMHNALRSWNGDKGKGLIKFYDAAGDPITWKHGMKIPYAKVSFSQGKSKKRFSIGDKKGTLNLRFEGKKYFPEVYENQRYINELKTTMVDNPFPGKKQISFAELMKKVYMQGHGWKANAPLFSIFHGPEGAVKKPFTNLSFGMQELNKAMYDLDKIPLKGFKQKVINQAFIGLKGKKGEKLLTAIVKKHSDIASKVAAGQRFDKPLSVRVIEEVVKTGDLGSREMKVAKNILNAFCGSSRKKFARAGVVDGLVCSMDEIQENIKKQTNQAMKATKDGKIPKKFGKLKGLAKFFGWIDAPIEFLFAARHLIAGDIEGAKRATTASIFNWGKVDLNKISDKEVQSYLKHIKAMNNYFDNYGTAITTEKELENLTPGTGAYDLMTNQFETAKANMDNIQENYQDYGYTYLKGDTPLKGKVLTQKYIRDKVKSDFENKIDKQASTEFFKDSDQELLKENLRDLGGRPEKVTPITDLESYMRNKGEEMAGNTNLFFNVKPYVLEEAEALGVPEIFDDYALGAGVEAEGRKSLQDAYSEIPIEYANQLAALEKKQLEEGLLEKRLTGFAGGGIASIRRPNAIPPKSGPNPQGLPSMYNRVKRI